MTFIWQEDLVSPGLWECHVGDYSFGGNDFGDLSPLSDDASSVSLRERFESEMIEEMTGDFVA